MRDANSHEARDRFVEMASSPVLDVGAGPGYHSKQFELAGLQVDTCDMKWKATFKCDFDDVPMRAGHYGGVWASHVLEHQRNPGLFLDRCHTFLREGGTLAVTVPPASWYVSGGVEVVNAGHVSYWNAGILLYHLVLARFDCSAARVHTYGKNVSVVVKKKTIEKLPQLFSSRPDMENLSQFMPIETKQGFNGVIKGVNW